MWAFRRFYLILVAFFLVACNLPKATPEPTFDPNRVATMVEETLAAFPSPAVKASATATSLPSNTPSPEPTETPIVSRAAGKICFPKSGRSDLRAFFQEINKGIVSELAISSDSNTYEIVLDPGNYIAYVWLPDFSFGGMYSSSGTTPSPFSVFPGETTTGIDLCDWNHGPFDVPYPPGYEPKETTGSISGTVDYPYGDIPVLTLVAFSKSTPYWYWVGTAPGQSFFTFSALPPGKYQVVAYDGSGRAGGSSVVVVKAGESTSANVTEWGGSFPSNPVK